MANIRFMYDNWADSATLTASSEASGFPVSNLKDRWYKRTHRTTGVTSEWWKWNLGSAKLVKCFVFYFMNFTSGATIHIQANSSDAWSPPALDVTYTWTSGSVIKFWDTPQNYQWWRMTVADAGNPLGYLYGGRHFIGTFFEPGRNFEDRNSRELKDPSLKRQSTGGQKSRVPKDHYKVINYSFLVDSPDDVSFESMFDEVGQSEAFFICETPGASPASNLFYVELVGDLLIPTQSGSAVYSCDMSVETER